MTIEKELTPNLLQSGSYYMRTEGPIAYLKITPLTPALLAVMQNFSTPNCKTGFKYPIRRIGVCEFLIVDLDNCSNNNLRFIPFSKATSLEC